jgi:hypothetical protein
MRLAKIICNGFRNLDCEISLANPYAVVLGWLDVHRRVNRGGIFDSPFNERVGISEPQSTAAIVFTRSAICEPAGAA